MIQMLKSLRNKFFSKLKTQLSHEIVAARDNIINEIRKEHGTRINSVGQKQLFHFYKFALGKGERIDLSNTGFRNYSQFEEDGLILFILAAIGIKSRTFVDVGSANGINSNCANLALNFGFHGLFVDGDNDLIEEGRAFYSTHPETWLYPPKLESALVKKDNINELIEKNGIKGEVDVLNIDIDGNDYWIWEALDIIEPRIVIIETHIELGSQPIAVPYDETFCISEKQPDYFGASAPAMVKLAERKGYRLVGTNRFGFNTIFVKGDEGNEILPKVELNDVLKHPRHFERLIPPEKLKEFKFVNL